MVGHPPLALSPQIMIGHKAPVCVWLMYCVSRWKYVRPPQRQVTKPPDRTCSFFPGAPPKAHNGTLWPIC
jgi:hypothetical protein